RIECRVGWRVGEEEPCLERRRGLGGRRRGAQECPQDEHGDDEGEAAAHCSPLLWIWTRPAAVSEKWPSRIKLIVDWYITSVGSLVWTAMPARCPISWVTTERATSCLVADGTAAVSALGVQRAIVVGSATVGSSMQPSVFTSSALS